MTSSPVLLPTTRPRLVAVDMDGTFLDARSTYDRERFADAHERLSAAGVQFVVASGNQYWQLRSYFEGFTGVWYVAENGAVVAHDDEVVRVTPFAPDAAAAALEVVQRLRGVEFIVCGRRSAYALADAEPWFLSLIRHYYHRLEVVASWADVTDDVVKFALIIPERARTPELLAGLVADLPNSVVPVSSGHGSIDLISRGINKGVALAALGERLGVPPEAMVAFGDGGNDVEMLALAGLGVAMANAPDAVKAHADAVAGHHDEHGVLRFLEDLLDGLEASPDGALSRLRG